MCGDDDNSGDEEGPDHPGLSDTSAATSSGMAGPGGNNNGLGGGGGSQTSQAARERSQWGRRGTFQGKTNAFERFLGMRYSPRVEVDPKTGVRTAVDDTAFDPMNSSAVQLGLSAVPGVGPLLSGAYAANRALNRESPVSAGLSGLAGIAGTFAAGSPGAGLLAGLDDINQLSSFRNNRDVDDAIAGLDIDVTPGQATTTPNDDGGSVVTRNTSPAPSPQEIASVLSNTPADRTPPGYTTATGPRFGKLSEDQLRAIFA